MDNMILGRYIPGDSIIHRLDPRSKLLAMFLLIVISFWANNPVTNLLLFVVTKKTPTIIATANRMMIYFDFLKRFIHLPYIFYFTSGF